MPNPPPPIIIISGWSGVSQYCAIVIFEDISNTKVAITENVVDLNSPKKIGLLFFICFDFRWFEKLFILLVDLCLVFKFPKAQWSVVSFGNSKCKFICKLISYRTFNLV